MKLIQLLLFSLVLPISSTAQVLWSSRTGQPGTSGSSDLTNGTARFSQPAGVARDAFSNLYVSDRSNHTIRKISSDGKVTTLAGVDGYSGSDDGPASSALFSWPAGVATDNLGNVYVADELNHTIRRIAPTGMVTTVAGQAGTSGSADGTGSAARFNRPRGVAVDGAGILYITDSFNYTVRRIDHAGAVTTLAGSAGQWGGTNGAGAVARFATPLGICVQSGGGDGNPTLFVAESGAVRKIDPTGVVSTVAGATGTSGSADGTGSAARFNQAEGIAADSSGTVYVTDFNNHTIRKVDAGGVVTTLAGTAGFAGSTDATGPAARFWNPVGISLDGSPMIGFTLVVCDMNNSTIRRVTTAGVASTLSGAAGISGSADGTSRTALFSFPRGLAVDFTRGVYIADGNRIRKIGGTDGPIGQYGRVSTFAGSGATGSANGTGTAATFFNPRGLAMDLSGNPLDGNGFLYVADQGNNTIRRISPAGVVSTFAGSPTAAGAVDGVGSAARFSAPTGVAVGSGGTVYVTDKGSHLIRKITSAGGVTTLAGTAFSSGTADGTGAAARFNQPEGIAVDGSGNVFVADTANHSIRKITPAGVVTTFAGLSGSAGSADGIGSAARFWSPAGIAFDSQGRLLVADQFNHTIRRIDTGGVVTTIGGTPGTQGNGEGAGTAAAFSSPYGIAVESDGTIHLGNSNRYNIVTGRPAADGGVAGSIGTHVEGGIGISNPASGVAAIQSVTFTLPNSSFFDTAGTAPGLAFTPFYLSSQEGGVTAVFPPSALTDGQRTATISFASFDPGDSVLFGCDYDLYSSPDSNGSPGGTVVSVSYADGTTAQTTLTAGWSSVLGVWFSYANGGFTSRPEIALEQPAGTALADGGGRDFGSCAVGSSVVLPFALKNTGTVALPLSAPVIDGTDAGSFSISGLSAGPVPAGSATSFTVNFSPTSAGAKSAVLHIPNGDDDENPYDIDLRGTGFVPAPYSVEFPAGVPLVSGVSQLDFGTVLLEDGAGAWKTITIRNNGSLPLDNFFIGDPVGFLVESTFLNGSTLPAGQSILARIRLNPYQAGPVSGQWAFFANGLPENDFSVNLAGNVGSEADVALRVATRNYLLASNAETNAGNFDQFGEAVAISGDLAVVGASGESSAASGINGSQSDNSLQQSGAAYVFRRDPVTNTLLQEAYLKSARPNAFGHFGQSVAISGNTVVVGAPREDGITSGNVGAVYIYVRNPGTGQWMQQAVFTLSDAFSGSQLGVAVAISGDTIVAGADGDQSAASGVNGSSAQVEGFGGAGAAYVFTRSGSSWTQQAYLKASNTGAGDYFGSAVAIDADTIVIGAVREASNATGLNGNAADNSADQAGAAYIFSRSGNTWSQQAYAKASNTGTDDRFGCSVAVSGNRMVVGAENEDSAATGIDGRQDDNSAFDAGAAYLFLRSGNIWSQQAYLKASNTGASDNFGTSVSISGDTIAVGAPNESSFRGALYLYSLQSSVWQQKGYVKPQYGFLPHQTFSFGRSVSIAQDRIIGGAFAEDGIGSLATPPRPGTFTGSGAAHIFDLERNFPEIEVNGWISGSTSYFPGGYIIRNHGNLPLTALTASISGPGAADFSISTPPATTVAPGGETTIEIATHPVGSEPRYATLSLFSNDADENPYIIYFGDPPATSPAALFSSAMTSAGLSGLNAVPSATPFNDGVENLLKYAFNMNLAGPDSRALIPGNGNSGLPFVGLTGTGPATMLRVEFLRRKASGLVYTPKRSSTLDPGSFVPMGGTPVVTSINDDWERVVVQETANLATLPVSFAVVEVTLP